MRFAAYEIERLPQVQQTGLLPVESTHPFLIFCSYAPSLCEVIDTQICFCYNVKVLQCRRQQQQGATSCTINEVSLASGGGSFKGGGGEGGVGEGCSPPVTLVRGGGQLQTVLIGAVCKEREAGEVNVINVGVILQDCLHITWGHLHIVPVSQQHPRRIHVILLPGKLQSTTTAAP